MEDQEIPVGECFTPKSFGLLKNKYLKQVIHTHYEAINTSVTNRVK